MTWWALLLLGWGLTAALQLGLWLWQRRTGSATVVDAGWAASLAGIAILYAILGEGGLEHRALVGITGASRFRPAHVGSSRSGSAGEEDPRYRELRRRWRERGDEQLRFLVFFQMQALAAVLLSVPLLAAAYNDHDGLEWLEWTGSGLARRGSLEAVADRQLDRPSAATRRIAARSSTSASGGSPATRTTSASG